jgi:AcrR family transcriptional regulator
VPRWEPGARERLRDVALELYDERGFEAVTVAEITDRAGLTRRTFFRHFADVRDVLFAGAEDLPDRMAAAVRATDPALGPLDAVTEAMATIGSTQIAALGTVAARRNAIICASPELRERERTKFAEVAEAIEPTLVERGAPPIGAQVLAQVGVALFQAAFARWVEDGGDFAALVREARADAVSCLAPSAG